MRVGLISYGGLFKRWGRGLLNLAKKVVSVLHKELEYQVEKFKYRKLEVMQDNLVSRAFPLKNGWDGKRPWHRLVTCPLVHPKILGVINYRYVKS